MRRCLSFNGRTGAVAVIALACALCTGCLYEEEDEDCTPTPFFCDRDRPSSADLTIEVGGGDLLEVRVYSGSEYETGMLVWSGDRGTTLRLPLGAYSATATYRSGEVTVIAVDGDDLDYSSEDTCSGPCYEEEDGLIDLRLR